MTSLHIHTTQYLDGEQAEREQFLAALRAAVSRRDNHSSVHALPSEQHIRWITWMSKDLYDTAAEPSGMDLIVIAVSQIFEEDVEIVTARQSTRIPGEQRLSWTVPGRRPPPDAIRLGLTSETPVTRPSRARHLQAAPPPPDPEQP
jgi:hypothetical protein